MRIIEPSASQLHSGADRGQRVLAEVRAIAPFIEAQAAQAEAARRIPADILQMLRAAGVFRMAVPRAYGGLELDYPAIAAVIQALIKMDGSIGWVCALNQGAAMMLPLLPQETYARIYQPGPDVLCAGVNQPAGKAVAEGGGWRVSGRWPFASGCEDASWIGGACVLTENGRPLPGPAEGIPAIRLMCLPAAEWEIEDTWHTSGLRATGSHHVVLRDAWVADENMVDLAVPRPCVPGPLYQAPLQITSLMHGAIALGMAEGALDDIAATARSGRQQFRATVAMRDSEIFQYELGRTQAELRAAQALFDAQAASHWRHALDGTLNTEPLLVESTQSSIWVTAACLRVTESCFALAGSSAIFESAPLQRRLRDLRTAAQHVGVQARYYAQAGKLLLSSPPATSRAA